METVILLKEMIVMNEALNKNQISKMVEQIKLNIEEKYQASLAVYPTNLISCHLYNHYYHLNRNKLCHQSKLKIMIYLQKHYFINGKIRTQLQVRKQEINNKLKQVKSNYNSNYLRQLKQQINALSPKHFNGSPNDLVMINQHQIKAIHHSDVGRIIHPKQYEKQEQENKQKQVKQNRAKHYVDQPVSLDDVIAKHTESGYDGEVKVKKIKK